jgi:hypothetical protein
MVSDEEAKERFVQAKSLANCDPSEYHRDYLVVESELDDDDEYSPEKIIFHSGILTELNKNLTEQISGYLSELGTDVDDEDEDYDSSDSDDPIRYLKEYHVDNHDVSPTPIQYIHEDDLEDDLEHSDRFRSILNDITISDETDFSDPNFGFQIFRVKNDMQPKLIAFKTFSMRQIVGSSFRVKVGSIGDSEYNKIKENPVALPDTFDAIYCDGIYFVFNPTGFEKIFDYYEAYEQDADAVFDFLESSDINIKEYDRLKEVVTNSGSGLRKMRKVEQKGKYTGLTQSRVEQMIDQWDLHLEVSSDDSGDWQISIPDFRKVNEVLGLLDDDFVVSGMDILAEAENEQKYFAKGGKETR